MEPVDLANLPITEEEGWYFINNFFLPIVIQIYENKIDKSWRGGECQPLYGEWHLPWLRTHSDFDASSAQSNGAFTGALWGNRVAKGCKIQLDFQFLIRTDLCHHLLIFNLIDFSIYFTFSFYKKLFISILQPSSPTGILKRFLTCPSAAKKNDGMIIAQGLHKKH